MPPPHFSAKVLGHLPTIRGDPGTFCVRDLLRFARAIEVGDLHLNLAGGCGQPFRIARTFRTHRYHHVDAPIQYNELT
jgi:hypothetical protein